MAGKTLASALLTDQLAKAVGVDNAITIEAARVAKVPVTNIVDRSQPNTGVHGGITSAITTALDFGEALGSPIDGDHAVVTVEGRIARKTRSITQAVPVAGFLETALRSEGGVAIFKGIQPGTAEVATRRRLNRTLGQSPRITARREHDRHKGQ